MPKINITGLDIIEVLMRLTKFAESKTVRPAYLDPEPLNLSTIRRLVRNALANNNQIIESIASLEINVVIITNNPDTELDTAAFDHMYGKDSAEKAIKTLRSNNATFFNSSVTNQDAPQPPSFTLPEFYTKGQSKSAGR